MSQKEVRDKIIVTIFDLEVKFDKIGDTFRDLARLLMKLEEAES